MSEAQDCDYCTRGGILPTLMAWLVDMPSSSVYLFRDQTHRGRCVVASKKHVTEIFLLSSEERRAFFDDVAAVAKAVKLLTKANKINYAIFGDLVPHLHVHVVPKRVSGPEWGRQFTLTSGSPELLKPVDFMELSESLRVELARFKDGLE